MRKPETPRRSSSLYHALPSPARELLGRGLTDHPTSSESTTYATHLNDVPLPKSAHAKIVFYSRGKRDRGQIHFPFNVEVNIHHE